MYLNLLQEDHICQELYFTTHNSNRISSPRRKMSPNKENLLDSISTSQYALANLLPLLELTALQLRSFIGRSIIGWWYTSKQSLSVAIANSFFKSLGKSEENSYPITAVVLAASTKRHQYFIKSSLHLEWCSFTRFLCCSTYQSHMNMNPLEPCKIWKPKRYENYCFDVCSFKLSLKHFINQIDSGSILSS